jgi:heat shock protein HslJ
VNESGALSPDDFSIGTVAGVANSWFVTLVSGMPYGPEGPPPLKGWPPHLFVTFEEEGRPEADPENFVISAPQGRVFPVEAYREMSDQAGKEFIGQWIDELQTILEEQPETFDDPIPVLPDVGATQDFRGKISYIDFTGGSGIGFIGHYGQDLGPFTNDSLSYFFQGLTSDGQHYLSFVQPLTTNFLPESFTDVPQETLDTINTDPQAYLQEVSQAIEDADSSDFTPNLDALVAMYGSITIGAPAAGTPTAGTPAAGTPAGTSATATTTATSTAPGITGFLWNWQELRGADVTNIIVSEPMSYTLSLLPDGSLSALSDCNQATGRYDLSDNGEISIDLTSGTREACPEGSLSEQYLDLLENAAAYETSGNMLVLELDSGGEMTFTAGAGEIGITETPEPGTATVTTTDVVNILGGPGSQYPSYGQVAVGTVLEVVGKSSDSAWWVVRLPSSIQIDGQGWVSARYVEPENTEGVPVVTPPPAP